MPRGVREYLVTEGQIRIAFLLGLLGLGALLVVILLLITAPPQGEYQTVESGPLERVRNDAAEDLSSYNRDPETGAISIPIERAMLLVAENGLGGVQFGQAGPPAQAPGGEGQAPGDGQAALGETTYANCAGCHGANGQGVPGAFPPLAGHLPSVARAEGGRAYLIDVLLYGLQGQITVNGQGYNGVMPPWPQLSDEQIAAVLNHELTSWGNAEDLADFPPILPQDVAAQRDAGLSAQDVHQERQELGLE